MNEKAVNVGPDHENGAHMHVDGGACSWCAQQEMLRKRVRAAPEMSLSTERSVGVTFTRWDAHFAEHALLSAKMSKDPEHQIGAVIVDSLRRIVGSGYNGFPRGVRDLPERYADKIVKRRLIVHAEANAILNASARVSGCVLYTTRAPCTECVKLVIQSGIGRVVSPAPRTDGYWADDSRYAEQMLLEAGVERTLTT